MARRSKARSLSIAIRQSPVLAAAIESPDDTAAFATAISTATGGEVGSGGSESVATAADLPLTGNEAGDFAFVQETNRLYLWNGQGWYNIALINTTPSSISGNDASYNLSTEGIPTVITLNASDPEGVPIQWSYQVTSGSLTNGGGTTATITRNDNIFTITPTVNQLHKGSFSITFTASDGINTVLSSASQFTLNFGAEPGGALYETPGTYSWVAPVGVTSVSVVAIGGGCGGTRGRSSTYRYGGPGGGLGWKNNISVTPGQSYTVVVGAGGTSAGAGGDSYFINATTVKGGGGQIPTGTGKNLTTRSGGGSYIGDGGGKGGDCANAYDAFKAGGGGGAGGYSGQGGHGGGGASNNSSPTSGAGGAGGGGGGAGAYYSGGGGGGGTGVYGQGPNGTAGANAGFPNGGTGASGGSGGSNGGNGGGQYGIGGSPGLYGAGAGSGDNTPAGGSGAVRIIWGDGRAFPSTNVDLASSTAGETTI